jgi:hypothetical protein
METKLKEMLVEMDSLYRLLVDSFRRALGTSHEASVDGAGQDVGDVEPVSPQAYLLANRRLQEIETEKAMAIAESRHDKWKAGGPL